MLHFGSAFPHIKDGQSCHFTFPGSYPTSDPIIVTTSISLVGVLGSIAVISVVHDDLCLRSCSIPRRWVGMKLCKVRHPRLLIGEEVPPVDDNLGIGSDPEPRARG